MKTILSALLLLATIGALGRLTRGGSEESDGASDEEKVSEVVPLDSKDLCGPAD